MVTATNEVDPCENSALLPDGSDEIIEASKTPSGGQEEYTGWKLLAAIGFTWLASFSVGVDSTLTSTLSATISAEFHDLTVMSWLASAYLVALAAIQPLSGKITDIYGRRSGLLLSSVVFAIGNAISGFARSKAVIILGRVIAGVGAGGLNSIGTYLCSDLIPLRTRGLWQAYGVIVYGVSLGLGGVVGGTINDTLGWRWAFLLFLPVSFVGFVGMWLCVPDVSKRQDETNFARLRRIDFPGALTLVASLVLLLWSLNSDRAASSGSVLRLEVAMLVAFLLLIIFVVIETRHAAEPILPIHLLADRTVLGVCLSFSCTSMVVFILMFYVPLFFQIRGYSPQATGVLLLPESLGTMIGSLSSGMIMRRTGNYGTIKVIAFVIFVSGAVGFSISHLSTPIALPELYLLFNGIGMGGTLTCLTLALLSAINHSQQASSTAMVYGFRQVAATVGITVAGTLFRAVLDARLSSFTHDTDISKSIEDVLHRCSAGTEQGSDCAVVLEAYMLSLRAVFLLVLGFAVSALISGLLTRNNKLHSRIDRRPSTEDENPMHC